MRFFLKFRFCFGNQIGRENYKIESSNPSEKRNKSVKFFLKHDQSHIIHNA